MKLNLNKIEELEKEEGGKVSKKNKTKAAKVLLKDSKTKKKTQKEDNFLFTLVIAAIIILGIIGIVFGYTKDKLTEIRKGGTDVTRGLEEQVISLKKELSDVKEKAEDLEKQSMTNKEVVIDLFDKNRKIPTKVKVADWNVLDDKNLSFTVSYPKTWEYVKSIVDTKKKKGGEVVYLQPIGQSDFINATAIKSDYADFANLTIKEKQAIFEELDIIDNYKFAHGKMLYFINFDKDNKEIPTILILTDDNIYRATFNVADKKLNNYFEFRKDFEKIVSTFAFVEKEE